MIGSKAIRLSPVDMQSIDQALQYVDLHYRSSISAEHLAIEVGLPKDKLQAGIRKKMKCTLHQYILRVRIEKAKVLLVATNSPLKCIAFMTGFKNENYFCKVFRRHTDISPISYRYAQVV